MRYFLLILTVSAAIVFSACQKGHTAVVETKPTPPPTNNTHADDGASRIDLADAKKAFDSGTAVFIDTRAADIYKQEHVKGAINITLQDDAAKYSTIPKGKKIIVYCS